MKWSSVAGLMLIFVTPLQAQNAPLQGAGVVKSDRTLPKNTPILLQLDEGLSTRSRRQKKGDTFSLSVARNVMFRGYIVIPRGARATGHIAWQTRKGAFGKSGKMELEFDYIDIGDTRVPISGKHRAEGDGNGDATVATFVFLSMLGSGFITGHSAEVPAGQQFTVWTTDDVPVNLPAEDSQATKSPLVVSNQAGGLEAIPPANKKPPAPAKPALPPSQFGNGAVRCITCN